MRNHKRARRQTFPAEKVRRRHRTIHQDHRIFEPKLRYIELHLGDIAGQLD